MSYTNDFDLFVGGFCGVFKGLLQKFKKLMLLFVAFQLQIKFNNNLQVLKLENLHLLLKISKNCNQ